MKLEGDALQKVVNPLLSLRLLHLYNAREFRIDQSDYHVTYDNELDRVAVSAHRFVMLLISDINPLFWDAAIKFAESRTFLDKVLGWSDKVELLRSTFIEYIKNVIKIRRGNPDYLLVPPPCYGDVIKS